VRGLTEDFELEVASQHRGGGEQAVALVREQVEAPSDHLPDAVWQRTPTGLALFEQKATELGNEERIASSLFVDGGSDAGIHRCVASREQVVAHVANPKAFQPEAPRASLAGELGEHRSEWVTTAYLPIPVAGDDQNATVMEIAREVPDECQRRCVAPLEIIQDDHQTAGGRHPLEQTGYGVEQTKPVAVFERAIPVQRPA
jgi:hypothetical protein